MPEGIAGGLEGVVAAETVLSDVDGERGVLLIRGVPLDRLARCGFEAAVALLWNGVVAERLDAPRIRILFGEARAAAFQDLKRWLPAARGRSVPEGLRLALAALPDASAPAPVAATLPVALAALARVQRGQQPVAPDPQRTTAEDFLRMLRGEPAEPRESEALDVYLATVIDHGLNASTFAARVVASTRASLSATATAAYCALTGPLHGGAPGPVLDMLDAIGSRERIESWLERALDEGQRLMGFGHRVYRVRDPRAEALKAALLGLDPRAGRLPFAQEVERQALALLKRRKPGRALETNVEFYTALLLDALGLPRETFVSVFALSRIAGWIAHAFEQRATGRLIRPASRYVGPVAA